MLIPEDGQSECQNSVNHQNLYQLRATYHHRNYDEGLTYKIGKLNIEPILYILYGFLLFTKEEKIRLARTKDLQRAILMNEPQLPGNRLSIL